MSIEYLNHALKIEGLTPTKKFILVVLANYADERGSCYPSYKHLAKIVGLKSFKGVQKAIKEFEELGFLRIEHRKLDNGGNTSNRYYLNIGGVVSDHGSIKEVKDGSLETTNTKDNTKDNIYSFEVFWKHYPRKIGKMQASKIFTKNRKFSDQIIYAVRRFEKDSKMTDPKFIPHPSTWLNQGRWHDYLEPDTDVQKKNKINKSINNLAG